MKSSELLRLMKKDGWYELRQSGSHIIMKHPIKQNQVTVPFHAGKEVPKGTLLTILKDAEINSKRR